MREAWAAALPECYAEPIAACVAGTPAPAAAAADADSSDEDGAAAPLPPASSSAPERHKYHRLVAQRRAYGDAWLAVLALPASRDTVQVCEGEKI